MITHNKYHTENKVVNPPHVVVFSNPKPDIYDKSGVPNLSLDRWKITEITNDVVIEEEKIVRKNFILEI